MQQCRYSVHDLSRVQLSGPVPRTPRFNMPFELGVAVTWSALNPKLHEWFIFEEQPHRLQRSLSDVSGTDPYVHHGDPEQILVQICNGFVRTAAPPSIEELRMVHATVRRAARDLRAQYHDLFGARAFEELVLVATRATAAIR